jgi:hypothetical protein
MCKGCRQRCCLVYPSGVQNRNTIINWFRQFYETYHPSAEMSFYAYLFINRTHLALPPTFDSFIASIFYVGKGVFLIIIMIYFQISSYLPLFYR